MRPAASTLKQCLSTGIFTAFNWFVAAQYSAAPNLNTDMATSKVEVNDKNGQPIKEGDKIWSRARGGKQEGKVDKIVMTEEEADKEGAKNPPKVLYTDQHGHRVSHNPESLQHKE